MALARGLLQLDLVRTNMHKVFVIGMCMVPSLAVFALCSEVRWLAGAALAVGNSCGGWLGTRFQVTRGEGVVRVVFAVAMVAMAAELLIGRHPLSPARLRHEGHRPRRAALQRRSRHLPVRACDQRRPLAADASCG
jgi:hypothetical protein